MPCDVTDESHVNKAAAVAASADLTILVIGDGSTASTAQNATPYEREVATVGEHFDRDDLDPAGAQMPLMRAVMKASKSVIIVMIGGRPMTFGASALDGHNKMFTDASAVIAAWHPGETISVSPTLLLIHFTSLHLRLRRFL
ncbi:glycoside hydrolase family 3 C-terminal domain-containing protein [bacterium]|jgi:beta-glucosidase|nr:glycoside hydrolase family 3 C-terminal domain-containing protein [bacterium]